MDLPCACKETQIESQNWSLKPLDLGSEQGKCADPGVSFQGTFLRLCCQWAEGSEAAMLRLHLVEEGDVSVGCVSGHLKRLAHKHVSPWPRDVREHGPPLGARSPGTVDAVVHEPHESLQPVFK